MTQEPIADAPVRWRDRQRAATEAQIKQVARDLLVEGGPGALTVRGVARELGMTAPAIYRYFASLDDLVVAVCLDLFSEAATGIAEAAAAYDDPAQKLLAAVRGFRAWARGNPGELRLMSTAVGLDADAATCTFAQVFLQLFAGLVDHLPAPRSDLPVPAYVEHLHAFALANGYDLPPHVLVLFMRGWVRLYGLVTLEVTGQLATLVGDVEPLFETECKDVMESAGLRYFPPA